MTAPGSEGVAERARVDVWGLEGPFSREEAAAGAGGGHASCEAPRARLLVASRQGMGDGQLVHGKPVLSWLNRVLVTPVSAAPSSVPQDGVTSHARRI